MAQLIKLRTDCCVVKGANACFVKYATKYEEN